MATTTIPNLPSGGHLLTSDLLVYEDVKNNITKKTTALNLFWDSKTYNVNLPNGLSTTVYNSETSSYVPITLTCTLYKIAPHLYWLHAPSINSIRINNSTSSDISITFTTDFSAGASGTGFFGPDRGITTNINDTLNVLQFAFGSLGVMKIQTNGNGRTGYVKVPANNYMSFLWGFDFPIYLSTDINLS